MVVGEVGRKAERDREQPAALRGEIVPRRIGAADDQRQVIERRIADIVDAQEGIERAAFALVAELDAVDVVGRAAGLLGGSDHLARRHVDELRLRIDESRDQPRTRDAIDLRPLARHPFAGRRSDLSVRGKTCVHPGRDAAGKRTRVEAGGTQRGDHALADVVAMFAISDHGTAGRQRASPPLDLIGGLVDGPDDQPIRARKGRRVAHIHDDRGGRGAEPRIKIVRRN